MNNTQKKLIVIWSFFLLIILLASLNSDWVHTNWDWLRWVSLTVIFLVFAMGGKETSGWGKPGTGLTEFIDTYPIIKFWITFSALLIIVFLAYAFFKDMKLHQSAGILLLAGFGTIFFPLFAFSEYLRFKRLGNKSSKSSKAP